MLSKEEFKAKWSSLHSDAETTGIVGAWLHISYRFGLICTLLRISPNVLTLLGLLGAVATAFTAQSLWAILFLVFSLFCDGIDGSVAIFQHRESKFGATLDSVVDRISEALWFYVAYRIGAPAWIVLLTYVTASTQEYARARLGGLGISEVGVVTPAERPVRASFIFIALVAYAIGFNLVNPVMAVLAALQLFSFYLVGRWAYNCLRNNFSA